MSGTRKRAYKYPTRVEVAHYIEWLKGRIKRYESENQAQSATIKDLVEQLFALKAQRKSK